MLGEVDGELLDTLGIDVVGFPARKNIFGFENRGWRPFTLFDGTEVLVPEDFQFHQDERGDLLLFPHPRQSSDSPEEPLEDFHSHVWSGS